MRIVAGIWRARRIEAPPGRDTRPTTDRVREAIFSAVYSAIGSLEGAAVIDLYAGSGALGIEALSRGAATCTFVESDRRAAATIAGNLRALGVPADQASVERIAVERFATEAPKEPAAALLLADPPYRIDASEFSQVLEVMARRGLLAAGALVVYEHASGTGPVWPAEFAGFQQRLYGDTAVSYAVYEG